MIILTFKILYGIYVFNRVVAIAHYLHSLSIRNKTAAKMILYYTKLNIKSFFRLLYYKFKISINYDLTEDSSGKMNKIFLILFVIEI